MMPAWMSDSDLDPYIELQIKTLKSPCTLDDWRELLTSEVDDEACLRVGQEFLSKLGIAVEKVRDIDDELEWLVWKLPYDC